MKKVEVKVVIGSNYGDECKGLATHYFSAEAAKNEKSCLNVLFNGGCQRDHTVETKDTQLRHIFHHFGSGTFDGAYTYFDQNFIVNPIFFCIEKSISYRTFILSEFYRKVSESFFIFDS